MSNIRWTVVTGASSGIGADLARCFSAIGHNLILVARRRERMEALKAELERRDRGRVEIIPCDLGVPEGPRTLHRAVLDTGLPIHTLVNNAGFGLRGEFAALPLDEQAAMIELNVTSLTKLCRLFLPDMIAGGRGGILNVSSTAAYQAGPHMAVYYATKAYVLSLSEALHEEAKPHGVTVTALCPGPTATEFQDRANMRHSRLMRAGTLPSLKVAQAGVDGYRAGHAVVVPGTSNVIGANLAKLMPRFITRRIAASLQS
jgi:short-subunit dehydrogenase